MKEVLTLKYDVKGDELQAALMQAKLNPIVGVIVTSPAQMKIAYEFDCDILPMFGNQAEALEIAERVSTASDGLIVIIGDAHEAQ